ncbi:hypothetical protein Cpap_0995 [Ruminiclostridium papyrosolvens DSM 2782]|uniref:DUF3021 domain-containing protein n=1 Tax=Ruminiclostridium papyrosolvens DSM 2782 TaxID=588581 RepID=F1TFZ4_9FIRM|nr:DUF3021 family protein [Ruminiclostridium papyrosolvens]EGD46613.1 hypothetical protein Cpap_0995 [Ruminiclostridium papyrosolvens DSM 2782]WES35764.1 DUF3021 family protein [Ruminiclostridium papyrosolvens DSM 2782]
MSFRSFLRDCAIRFFIIATCLNVATAVFGSVLQPDATLGFDSFYSPLIGAALGTLPSFILYSRKELNLRQTIIRKVLHLLALEIVIIGFSFLLVKSFSLFQIMFFVGIVLVVYLVVNLIDRLLQIKDTREINSGLKALQNRK